VALALIDFAALGRVPGRLGRAPRALDVACGTGALLAHLCERGPGLEAYGVDASADMLARARAALRRSPGVRLERAELGTGATANLPYAPGTFDLITCTNTLHYLPDPVAALAGMGRLLAPGGQLIVEDYARRESPFPWAAFEWLVRRVDPGHVRAYTLAEARALCGRAGLCVVREQAFVVDWLWHGWALGVEGAGG
jgi:ubiquinone/menaquinone biosynthesis C-methylase UbiE